MKVLKMKIRQTYTLFIALFFLIPAAQAQITGVTVDAGPYSPGSTIAATFEIGAATAIERTNQFEMVLSDATGSFSPGIVIGTYNGFYSSFVNGTVPSSIPDGNGYRIRIRTTVPTTYFADSNPFTISNTVSGGITAGVSSFPALGSNGDTFGYCPGRANAPFNFESTSTSGGTVTARIINELTNTTVTTLTLATPQAFTAAMAHYTVFVKNVLPDGRVATRAYLLLNNDASTSFTTPSNSIVCLPGGALQYGVDLNAMRNNFPGNLYRVRWGDGTENYYTFYELGTTAIRHEYTESSCGQPPYVAGATTLYNVFVIGISQENPFCGTVGTPISTSAKVVDRPRNDFTYLPFACTGTPHQFVNRSTPGQAQSNAVDCEDNDVRYNWYVNGTLEASNYPVTRNFEFTFPANGTYTIRLESVNNGFCVGLPISYQVCV